MTVLRLGADDHNNQGKFTDLGEINGGQQADAIAVAEAIKQGINGKKTGKHQEPRDDAGDHEQARFSEGIGDNHAECDKEEDDEKIPDIDDLTDDIEVIGKGGQSHPGNQGPHFHGESQVGRQAGDQKAPAQRGHQHDFRQFGDAAEDIAQEIAAHQETDQNQERAFGKG